MIDNKPKKIYHLKHGKDEKAEKIINIKVKLPKKVKCRACVLRWMWTTGTRYGCWPDGRCCRGCGREQETFINCADISIGYNTNEVKLFADPGPPPPTTPPPPQASTRDWTKDWTPDWFTPEYTPDYKKEESYTEVEGDVDGYGKCTCDCSNGQNYGYTTHGYDPMWGPMGPPPGFGNGSGVTQDPWDDYYSPSIGEAIDWGMEMYNETANEMWEYVTENPAAYGIYNESYAGAGQYESADKYRRPEDYYDYRYV